MTGLETLLCTFLIAISAFLSSSEVALFSLTRPQLRHLKSHSPDTYWNIRKLLSHPPSLLLTILVTNELVNVLFTTILASHFYYHWNSLSAWFSEIFSIPSIKTLPTWTLQTIFNVLCITPLILFFGEITPKTIGVRLNQWIALIATTPLKGLHVIFSPLQVLLKYIEKKEETYFQKTDQMIQEKEFLKIAEEGFRQGEVRQDELELMKNIFELDDTSALSIMTPIEKTFMLPATLSCPEALKKLKTCPFSRIPIYQESKTNVIGMVTLKNLIPSKLSAQTPPQILSSFTQKTIIVFPTTKLHTLFHLFKNKNKHMALVQNKAKQTIGMITMHDLLDEVFEEVLPT